MSEWKKSGSLHRFRVERHRFNTTDAAELGTNSRIDDSSTKSPDPNLATHLGTNSAPRDSNRFNLLACQRCKRLKRKCDRSLPQCHLCKKVGASCNFPDSPDPATNSRISWLSTFVDSLLPQSVNIESLRTGTDLRAIINHPPLAASENDHAPNPNPVPSSPVIDIAPERSSLLQFPREYFHDGLSNAKLHPVRGLPSDITPMTLIRAYFNQFHRTYPILDKSKVLLEAESMMDLFDQESIHTSLVSIKLYLIMALGCALICRTRQIPHETFAKFRVPYTEVVQLCLQDPSVESTQVLLLLALHSLHDPIGWPPWTVTSLLGRQAMFLGLNCNTKSESDWSDCSPSEMESRRRLFWSIFSIDRLVSVSFGLPFAIDGDDFNIRLPGVTMEEFAAPQQVDHFTTLQVARQTIALREIEGKIHSRIHLESYRDSSQLLDGRDCRRVVEQFHAQADNWYTQGCLYSRVDTNNVPIHTTISWLTVNYHRILALLHYPSRFGSQTNISELPRLQQLVRNYVQSLHVQFEDGHLASNQITLNRLLVISRTLLQYYSSCQTATDTAELDDVVQKCISMLESFAPEWRFAKPCCLVFRRFADLIASSIADTDNGTGAQLSSHTPNCQNDSLEAIIGQSESLIRQALGVSSIYNYLADAHRLVGPNQ